MRKRIFCGVLLLLLLALNALCLTGCADEMETCIVPSVTEWDYEWDEASKKSTVTATLEVAAGESILAWHTVKSYSYRIVILDGDGEVIGEESFAKSDSLGEGEAHTHTDAVEWVDGVPAEVLAYPESFELATNHVLRTFSIIIGCIIIFGGMAALVWGAGWLYEKFIG